MTQEAETDFRDVLRRPVRMFGYVYVYILLVALGLGVLYAWRLNDMGKNAIAPVALKDSSAFQQDIPFQSPAVLPPVDVRVAAQVTPAQINRGRDLFKANCSSCHGENGQGDGPSAATLNPRPRNFHVATGWTNGPGFAQIYKTLQEGIVRNGMAAYNYLPPADRFALLHFVRTFQSTPPPVSDAELQQLEATYQLSQGSTVAGHVPVQVATRLVLKEAAAMHDSVDALVKALHADASPGASVLRSVTADPHKVAVCLLLRRPAFQGQDELMRAVAVNPGGYGLRPSVAQLSAGQWMDLSQYLLKGGV